MAIPEKHRATAHAYVDGATIQARQGCQKDESDWVDLPGYPTWAEDMEYRVKPEREYPTTYVNTIEFVELYERTLNAGGAAGGRHRAAAAVANAAIRHAIDDQQVVPMAEVQEVARQLADKRVLAVAEAVCDALYAKVMNCDAGHEGTVVRLADLPAIIATVKD